MIAATRRPTMLFSPAGSAARWVPVLNSEMPELDIRIWPDIGRAEDIDVAMVWKPPHGVLASLPNLKMIQSLGTGVEHLLEDPALPGDVPIVRLVDPYMTKTVAEYVVCQVIRLHRQEHLYVRQQQRDWRPRPQVNAEERRVGILGLGELGRESARLLQGLGFAVSGWNRSGNSVDGIKACRGPEGMRALAEQSDILVCLLPLTDDTKDIIGEPLLSWLPANACIVNCGRGPHVNVADLSAALERKHTSGAVLDVFDVEPLSGDHPLWSTPGVLVTPHVAAQSNPPTGAKIVVESIRACLDGRPLANLVNRGAGY